MQGTDDSKHRRAITLPPRRRRSGEGGVPGLTSAGWLNPAGATIIAPAWAGRAPGHVTTAVSWDFRGTSPARPRFPCLGHGFHPWWGAKVPHATQCLLGGRKQVVSGKRTLLTPGLGCMLREAGSLSDGTAHCQLRLVTPQQSTVRTCLRRGTPSHLPKAEILVVCLPLCPRPPKQPLTHGEGSAVFA